MIMNWTKLPVFCFEGRVTGAALYAVLPMLPLILLGAVLGVLFVKRAPQRFFEIVIEIIVIVSAVKLLWPSSPADPPEPAAEQTEETAPAGLRPPVPEPTAAG
jgi:uncharacterized membrane protein YfcA